MSKTKASIDPTSGSKLVKPAFLTQGDAQTEVKKSKQEMERLMQMVKVSQEEQMAKDKLIKELQEWVIRKMFSIQCR